jgi:hypothetical protein
VTENEPTSTGAITRLRAELDRLTRSRSDHNPWPDGVVLAVDLADGSRLVAVPDRAEKIAASVDRIDQSVPTYVALFAELAAHRGKGEAYAEFNRRLLALPADVVAALATGAIAKLSENADNPPTGGDQQ